MSMGELRASAVEMRRLQDEKATLEEQLAKVNITLDILRTKKIPELMESMELRNCTIEGLGRIQLATDLYASTRAGKKDEAMLWLRDCGYENMITATYNASSLKALFRSMIAEGAEIPDEIFSVTPFVRASIVKA